MRVAPERSTVTFVGAFKTIPAALAIPSRSTVRSMSRRKEARRGNPQVKVDALS